MARRKKTPTHLNLTLTPKLTAYVRRTAGVLGRSLAQHAMWLMRLGIKFSDRPDDPAVAEETIRRGRPWPKKAGGK